VYEDKILAATRNKIAMISLNSNVIDSSAARDHLLRCAQKDRFPPIMMQQPIPDHKVACDSPTASNDPESMRISRCQRLYGSVAVFDQKDSTDRRGSLLDCLDASQYEPISIKAPGPHHVMCANPLDWFGGDGRSHRYSTNRRTGVGSPLGLKRKLRVNHSRRWLTILVIASIVIEAENEHSGPFRETLSSQLLQG
jgi:hypothetical protein